LGTAAVIARCRRPAPQHGVRALSSAEGGCVRYVIGILAVAGVIFLGLRYRGDPAPSANAVEPVLKAYLERGKGNCTVDHLSDITVGKFAEGFGGWPVYASHEETCTEGLTSATYRGLDDVKKGVAVAFVRKSPAGDIELFVPPIFRQGQQEMQKAFDKAAEQVGASIDKSLKK
jgi:hypothetical protein